jgi:hypothetical protein
MKRAKDDQDKVLAIVLTWSFPFTFVRDYFPLGCVSMSFGATEPEKDVVLKY